MPPLATILRYGTAREMPEAELRLLVTSLAEAVCSGLGAAKRRTPSPVISLTPCEQGMTADASRDRILRRVKL